MKRIYPVDSGSAADAENADYFVIVLTNATPPTAAVAPEKALDTAHPQAINRILRTATDEEWKNQLKNIRTELENKQ